MAPRELLMPELGEDDLEGTVVAVLVAADDYVDIGQALLEVETDKVTMEVPAESAGRIRQMLVRVGDTTRAGEAFALIAETSADSAPSDVTSPASPPPEPPARRHAALERAPPPEPENRTPVRAPYTKAVATVPAGPAARREARELGITISTVHGTGVKGRISKKDVRAHAKRRLSVEVGSAARTDQVLDLPDLAAFGPVHREPLSRIQHTTARKMTRSSMLIPHAWIERQVEITLLESSRQAFRKAQPESEPPLTLTALICKAVAAALRGFPRFNAALDVTGQELVLRDYTNIGVAVDTERGLVVPVIRDAAGKTALEIAAELDQCSRLARGDKLSPDQLRGAGITITNLGGIGVSAIQPVINWPEVAIVGVASSHRTPAIADGRLAERLMLPLTLGFDHRVINGADAARFLGVLAQGLDNPLELMTAPLRDDDI
jgi:pyruvate dehydrogenase E2 component (dihydrolipoamide acetyltransferase)